MRADRKKKPRRPDVTPSAEELAERARSREAAAKRRAAIAAKAFPNDGPNWTPSRKPVPTFTRAKTPSERFHDLAATYETYARPYQFKRLAGRR